MAISEPNNPLLIELQKIGERINLKYRKHASNLGGIPDSKPRKWQIYLLCVLAAGILLAGIVI